MNSSVPYQTSKAATIDLEPILVKLCHPSRGLGWDRGKAERAVNMYRRWLYLHQIFPEESFSPSQEIDQVWHAHLLDNRKYEEDCQIMFGRTLYHNPYAGMMGPEDEMAQRNRFAHTKRRFAECFPEPNTALQGEALCDSNYCDDTTAIRRPTMDLLAAA